MGEVCPKVQHKKKYKRDKALKLDGKNLLGRFFTLGAKNRCESWGAKQVYEKAQGCGAKEFMLKMVCHRLCTKGCLEKILRLFFILFVVYLSL